MNSQKPSEIDLLREQVLHLERDVAHLIKHDQLTGLLNRAAFISTADKLLNKVDPIANPSVMIEVAVSGLPRIAGNLGRHAGDYVISALAARINQNTDEYCIAGRLDYANFALFIPSAGDALQALATTKHLIETLRVPIDWVDRKLTMEVSAGVAMSSVETNDALGLLQNTALALRQASDRSGPSYSFFNPALAQSAKRRNDIVGAIEEAIEHRYLLLYYQPVFSLTTSELVGFEALMRMQHPKLGFVSPGEFIPVAEEVGLISKLGSWALAEACRAAVTWPHHLTVSVNVSPDQFYNGALMTDVHHALQLSSFPAYRLEIEITESTMLKDSEVVLSQLNSLREMGCSIVMDDFGTGYSSLSYLWKFAFNKLKIDRSFIQALDSTTMVKGMLRSIIDLSRNLGLKVTAEGIETQEQAELIRSYGCDYVQGFLCGRPVPETDIAAVIMKNVSEQLRRPTASQVSGVGTPRIAVVS
jgi:diguanylate cyclase (GGDEF)-like protein